MEGANWGEWLDAGDDPAWSWWEAPADMGNMDWLPDNWLRGSCPECGSAWSHVAMVAGVCRGAVEPVGPLDLGAGEPRLRVALTPVTRDYGLRIEAVQVKCIEGHAHVVTVPAYWGMYAAGIIGAMSALAMVVGRR